MSLREIGTVDSTRRCYQVDLSGALGDSVALSPDTWQAWRDRAHVSLAAEMVGTARRLFDMTLAYAKERKQFDVPIGSFQAIQHKLADLALALERATAAVQYASMTVDAADDDRTARVPRRQGRGGRRGPALPEGRNPDPRRHRLHVGARPPLVHPPRDGIGVPPRTHLVAPRPPGRPPVRMKLGLFGNNMGALATPAALASAVRAAEDAGFDSVWAGEHVILPDPQVPPSPMGPQDPALDPLLSLAWAAAHSSTLRLATGIVIVPQRNPVVLAKQVASLDVLSNGRVTLGVGVGYLEPEFRAIGADFENRGAVTDEYLDAMHHLWYDEHPEFHGRFADFAGVDAYPRPVQQPIPIVIGGHTRRAYRRAVMRGQGWYGFAMTPEGAAESLAGLRSAASEVERPTGFGPLEITVTPRGRLTVETATAFAELGVDRLVPFPPDSPDGVTKAIANALDAVSGLH